MAEASTRPKAADNELPVAIGALVWCLSALFVLVAPAQALVPGLIVVGLLLAGGVYFAYMWVRNPAVLETEPGTSVFER
jgi:hypothetical protein